MGLAHLARRVRESLSWGPLFPALLDGSGNEGKRKREKHREGKEKRRNESTRERKLCKQMQDGAQHGGDNDDHCSAGPHMRGLILR